MREGPLAFFEPGREVEVVGFRAGFGLQRRLAEMGIYPGVRLRVINSGPGPVLVEVWGGRLALGRGVAMKIWVREI